MTTEIAPVCSHCGGQKIARKLKLGQSAEVGSIGLDYQSSGSFLGISVTGTEPLYADLCKSCGTVTRLYVMNADQKWNHN